MMTLTVLVQLFKNTRKPLNEFGVDKKPREKPRAKQHTAPFPTMCLLIAISLAP